MHVCFSYYSTLHKKKTKKHQYLSRLAVFRERAREKIKSDTRLEVLYSVSPQNKVSQQESQGVGSE